MKWIAFNTMSNRKRRIGQIAHLEAKLAAVEGTDRGAYIVALEQQIAQAHDEKRLAFRDAFMLAQRGAICAAFLTHIIHIVAYTETHKLESVLIDHARNVAGQGDIKALAGEVLKQLDIFNSTVYQTLGRSLRDIDGDEIIDDARAIHSALLAMDNGDNGAQLRQTVPRAGYVAQWSMPDEWKKPTGMKPERKWLAERIILWKKRNGGTHADAGRAIYRQIRAIDEMERTVEEQWTLNALNRYMSDQGWVEDRKRLKSFISTLLSENKN